MKLKAGNLTSGMIVLTPGFPGDDEPSEYRHEVKETGPADYFQVSYVDGCRTIIPSRDSEVEVEIPGFIEVRTDPCGCEWLVVDGDSPVGVDAASDEFGYIRTKRCGDSPHHGL